MMKLFSLLFGAKTIRAVMVKNMAAVSAVTFLIYSRNEKQVVTLTNGSAGETFKLTFEGQLTTAIAYDATAAALELVLEALSNVEVGEATVSGSAGGPYTVEFSGQWAGQNVDIMTSSAEVGDLSVAVTNTTPANTLLAGNRGLAMNLTADKADFTNKDSLNWEESLSLIRHYSVSGDFVIDETNAALMGMREAFFNKKQVNVRIVTPGGTEFTGIANLDSYDEEGPHDNIYSASISFSGNGALATV